MQVRKMRLLRHKYGITRQELGRACGLSPQRISELELDTNGIEAETAEKIRLAFEGVMRLRLSELMRLEQDYIWHRDSLMDAVEEIGYEL